MDALPAVGGLPCFHVPHNKSQGLTGAHSVQGVLEPTSSSIHPAPHQDPLEPSPGGLHAGGL